MNEVKKLKIKITEGAMADSIRAEARAEGWTGSEGFKAWAKETYNARLRIGQWGMLSIKFKNEQDYIMFALKHGR